MSREFDGNMKALAAVTFMVALSLVLSAGAGSTQPKSSIRIRVLPGLSIEDQPLAISIGGLKPRSIATISLQSRDAQGTRWSSTANFRATADGIVDLRRSRSLSGAYSGVWQMGLLAMMTPATASPAGAYFWSSGPQLFLLTVHDGSASAAKSFRRQFLRSQVRLQHETLRSQGFAGSYWFPRSGTRRSAILAIGGSEGGTGPFLLAALLAAHGYPTLAISYFNAPGLPPTLSRIPLEYFARALGWLRQQPQVNPREIITLGISRGSEAALLLGVHYPHLVSGVIGSVPANVALCSYPGCSGPAWTFQHKPLPYTSQFNNPSPTDDPAAVIPVERIKGPVFLDCATEDQVWHSCAYARAIIDRLNRSHAPYQRQLVAAPSAGHETGSLIPFEPQLATTAADERGRELIWPELLAFLRRLSH